MKKRRAEYKPGSLHEFAYQAERFIATRLPRAVHVNEWFEHHRPYDIQWDNIYIDVKATAAMTVNASGKFCSFTAPTRNQADIIMVYMYVHQEPKFWVAHSSVAGRRYFTDSCTSLIDLEKTITDCHKKYSSIYKKTVDKQLSIL